MDIFDDRPLEHAPQPIEAPQPPPPRATPVMVIALVGLVLGGAGAWWWIRASRAPQPATPAAAQSTDAVLTEPADDPSRPLPMLSQMDTFLRALLGRLSAHPDFGRWLATDDLIRQMANVIDRISRGQSPAPEVTLLRPRGDFEVTRGGSPTITAASFRRYDGLATIVESLDAKAVVDSYRTIHPRLDEAYRALGRAEGGVDDAISAALQILIETPIPAEPVRVSTGKGTTYIFANAEYEGLLPAQKQLLRLGPDNARRIQARLREIQQLLRD